MVVVLLGPPGVGKGTQAVRLADELDVQHVSTGDLLRAARRDGTELGRKAQEYMDAGNLVPDPLILDLVGEHLAGPAANSGVLFDGFPRTTAQADGLDAVLRERGRQTDLVVLFNAPTDVLIKRLSGRRSCPDCAAVWNAYFNPPEHEGVCDRCGGTLVHRADDDPDTVGHRLEVYEKQTAPLISYYRCRDVRLVEIDADRAADVVFEDFQRAVRPGSA